MRGVRSAVLGRHARHLHQFVGGCERSGRINQRSGHPHGAALHRGLEDRLHLCQFFRGRRPCGIADDGVSGLRLVEVAAEVDADAGLLEAGEVFRHAFSADRRAALTANRRRHAHAQLVFGKAVGAKHGAGLVHHVDPPGRHVPAPRIQFPRPGAGHAPNLHEAPVFDRYVRKDPRIAHAVEHAAVAYDDVVDGGLLCGGRGEREDRRGANSDKVSDKSHGWGSIPAN